MPAKPPDAPCCKGCQKPANEAASRTTDLQAADGSWWCWECVESTSVKRVRKCSLCKQLIEVKTYISKRYPDGDPSFTAWQQCRACTLERSSAEHRIKAEQRAEDARRARAAQAKRQSRLQSKFVEPKGGAA